MGDFPALMLVFHKNGDVLFHISLDFPASYVWLEEGHLSIWIANLKAEKPAEMASHWWWNWT